MTFEKILYSIVIPVYNSGKSLTELYERLTETLTNEKSDYEIIFVDDDSIDNSWQVLTDIREKDKKVKIIQNTRNFGQHLALLCGFRHSKGKYIITMDDDLQHPPEEIPKLIHSIKEDDYYDVVIGHPKRKKHKFFRNFLSNIANSLNSYFFDKPKNLRMGAFRIINRDIIDIIININSPNFVVDPTLFVITKRIKNVEVKHDKRKHGKSQYSLGKLFRLGFDNISMNSTLPLKIVSVFGIISAFVSFLYGFYILLRWIFAEITVPGWTSIMLVLLFFSGIILISMGIIGEYLIRIIRATNQNYQYFVRKKEIE